MNRQLILAGFLLLFLLSAGRAGALKPMASYQATPADYGMKYTETDVPGAGVSLKSWFCKHGDKGRHPIVIICPGDYGNMSYQLPVADSLYQRGADVILFDYRGFGQSSSVPLDSNALVYEFFWKDFADVYGHYKKANSSQSIHVLAFSMGTIVVTMAGKVQPGLIDGHIIFDSYIFSPAYTVSVLKSVKGRPFFANIDESGYHSAQQALYRSRVLDFQGAQDVIANPPDFDWGQTGNWKIASFNGGHLGARTGYVGATGTPAYFEEIFGFIR